MREVIRIDSILAAVEDEKEVRAPAEGTMLGDIEHKDLIRLAAGSGTAVKLAALKEEPVEYGNINYF